MQGGLRGAATNIRSLDDVPELARVAARQQFLRKWYRPVALAPFVVFLIVSLKLFPDTQESSLWTGLIFASLLWAIAVAGYAFYTNFWGFRCPVCGWRFGSREKCGSCGLPRHADEVLSF